MEASGQRQFVERRNGPDLLTKSIHWAAVGGWIIMLVTLIVLDQAKPEYITFVDRFYGIDGNLRSTWDFSLARIIFYLMIVGFLLGTYGFIINIKRSRRKSDRYRINLFLLAGISLFGSIYYLVSF